MDGRLLLAEIRGRPIDLVPGKKVISINPGEWTSPFEGKGFEPRGYRDFVLGDSPRQIHLPTSARRGVPTIVERVAIRDFKLMIIVDLSPSMRVRDKLRIQHEAAAIMLYAAWQAETTFALAVRTAEGIHSYGLGIGSRHFYHAFRILWSLCTDDEHFRMRGSTIHLRRCLPPNAMLLYCSDFLDADGGISRLQPLLRAVTRYDFIPIIIQDQLEASFPQSRHESLISFGNPETAVREDVWVSQSAAERIAQIHETRYRELVAQFVQRDIKPVHLGEPGVEHIRASVDTYFRRRRRLSS
ncbi:MAG: DUF58 domain-containing protein [Gammaproteobacteria bacterium]|nr:DUF58 domain-containing protein [Gammaproteobacteria bacterium]